MTTRRAILSALVPITAGTLAGCSAFGGNGSGEPGELTTVNHRQWLAEPAIFDTESYVFSAVAPTPLLDRADKFDDRATPQEPTLPVVGVDDHEQVDEYVLFGTNGAAATGSFDADPVVSAIEERGYRPADSIRGFDGYETGSGRVGVVEDGLVVLAGGDDARERVAALLATRDGDRDRYHETDADVGQAIDAIDDGQIVSVVADAGAVVDLAEARALAYSASLGDGTLTVAMAVAFPEGETDADAVEAWADQRSMFYGADVRTSVVGRTVRAEATVELGEVTGFAVTTRLFPLPAPVETETTQEQA